MDSGFSPPVAACGPRTIICYICGRQYGVHSYDIHLKQCKDLWVARESKKPLKERKPLPIDPMLGRAAAAHYQGGGGSTDSATTKRSSPLQKGSPSSAVRMSAADIAAMNEAAQEVYNNVSLEKCEWCGRTFLAEKLAIHHRSCTQDSPARRITDPVKRGNSINSRELSSSPLRPRTTSSAVSRGRRKENFQEESRLEATTTGTIEAPPKRRPPTTPSPLTNKRGVTSIQPVSTEQDLSESEYSEAYKSSKVGSPMRGPSGSSLRKKRPSPVKADPTQYDNSDSSSASSSPAYDHRDQSHGRAELPQRNNVENTRQTVRPEKSKEETARYLAQRISEVEQQAVSLVQSVGEIKALLGQLYK